ncbi:hypothetical protein B2J88_48315 [Rhodococcus sp. SRB_17]|nr:hypothetical protein [Rhodococcus sp. SRB_17]
MNRRIITGIATVAAAASVAVAFAPAASAAPAVDPASYPTVFEFRLNHDQTVLANNSGVPAALEASNITVPVAGWANFVTLNGYALNKDIAIAAVKPRGCFAYVLRVPPAANTWNATTTMYPTCPW